MGQGYSASNQTGPSAAPTFPDPYGAFYNRNLESSHMRAPSLTALLSGCLDGGRAGPSHGDDKHKMPFSRYIHQLTACILVAMCT